MRWTIAVAVLGLVGSMSGVEASKKKKEVKPKTLCPFDEMACPIIGSTCVPPRSDFICFGQALTLGLVGRPQNI